MRDQQVLGTCLVIFLSRLVQDATSAELLLQYKPQDEGSTSCLDLIRRVFQTKWAKSDLGGSDRSVSKSEARLLGALHDIITSDQKDTKHKVSLKRTRRLPQAERFPLLDLGSLPNIQYSRWHSYPQTPLASFPVRGRVDFIIPRRDCGDPRS